MASIYISKTKHKKAKTYSQYLKEALKKGVVTDNDLLISKWGDEIYEEED